jgi:DNA polymerase V
MDVRFKIYLPPKESSFLVPLAGAHVRAGFPSPADDFLEDLISLDKELVKNKASTFYAKVIGDSMEGEISEGDILVIDRSLPLQNNRIAVCYVDGEFTVKRIKREGGTLLLLATNSAFEAIRVTEENQFMIWGMVTFVVKRVW